MLTRRAASNIAAVKMDLASAILEGDADRVTLLQTLIDSGGDILLYRPQLQHYAVLFGDIEAAAHVAVFVPGVGDGTNLCDDWIPEARNLFEAAPSTAVVLWKGYDNPADIARRRHRHHRMQRGPVDGSARSHRVRRVARARPRAVRHPGRAQFRVDRGGRRVGRMRPARHRCRRGGEPGHDGGRAPATAPRSVALLLRAGAGRRHRRAGHLRDCPQRADLRGNQDEHERARSSDGRGALQLLRTGVTGAREHGRRGDRPVLRGRAAPTRFSRDRRGTGGLGPPGAGAAGVRWPGGTTAAPASGCW